MLEIRRTIMNTFKDAQVARERARGRLEHNKAPCCARAREHQDARVARGREAKHA